MPAPGMSRPGPRRRLAALAPLLCLAASLARAQAMQDIPADAVERAALSAPERTFLDDPRQRWKHLQTDHFILHHDQKMFASRVARMGEQFYAAISADLPGLQDRTAPQRSHIFIFRNARDWQAVLDGTPGLEPWAASFVRGNVMFLQEVGTASSDKMGMLAHEMTHLVFNRFLPVRLPLWLNEGLAEYYGEFAYRAARGMGQGKRNAFPPLRQRTPIAELLNATTYPVQPAEVSRFYATSKYLVGYLLWKLPRDRWDAFFSRVLAGDNAQTALLETYGWADLDALEKEFVRFTR